MQLEFAEGLTTPLMQVNEGKDYDLQSLSIDTEKQITKISLLYNDTTHTF